MLHIMPPKWIYDMIYFVSTTCIKQLSKHLISYKDIKYLIMNYINYISYELNQPSLILALHNSMPFYPKRLIKR